jgi:glycosyltransferase involved in cell wall biosynthesis
MAIGKAVAVSDLPSMKELVRDGETGLTFAAGDEGAIAQACSTLLGDAVLRERLGRAAREYVVADRQWPDLVKKYRAVYESTASR